MSLFKQFQQDGYCQLKSVFQGQQLRDLQQEFDRIVTQLQHSQGDIDATWEGTANAQYRQQRDEIIHTHNVQRYSRVWLDALLSEEFLTPVRELLGNDIVLHHSKLFQKPAERGSPFPIHQDWSYFPTHKDSMIAAIIHLTEASDEMGCLRVYPGSHKLGRVTDSNGRGDGSALADYPLENAKVLAAEPGDIVLFHYFTLHGSMPNRSAKTRKTVLCQLRRGDDAIEASHAHTDEQLVLSGWNYAANRDNTRINKPLEQMV